MSFKVPANLRGATLANTEDRPDVKGWDGAISSITSALNGSYGESWLFICGPVGSGKTRLAAIFAQQAHASGLGWVMRWEPVQDIIEKLRPSDNLRKWRNKLVEADPLIIDDLGSEYASEWGRAEIERLISKRYDSRLMTVITSNLPFERIPEKYGERVADRLREISTVIELIGPSYRGRS